VIYGNFRAALYLILRRDLAARDVSWGKLLLSKKNLTEVVNIMV